MSLILVKLMLHAGTFLLQGITVSLGLLQHRLLLGLVPQKFLDTLLVLSGLITQTLLYLLQQLIEGRAFFLRQHTGGQAECCNSNQYKFNHAIHYISSAALTGSRRRSGAICLRAILRPSDILFLYSAAFNFIHLRSFWSQTPFS